MNNDAGFIENEGDAFGPGATLQSSEDGRISAAPPIAPAHSPLPWALDDRTVYVLNEMGANRFAALVQQGWSDKHDTRIAIEECEANAAFIVRACNSHYELLAACVGSPNPSGIGTMSNYFILSMAIAALRDGGHQTLAAELHAIREHQRAAISKATQQ